MRQNLRFFQPVGAEPREQGFALLFALSEQRGQRAADYPSQQIPRQVLELDVEFGEPSLY
ncbi:hypothetical protein ACM61V_16670 [Sphingomonas sp. TX0543]|uniref:hypothetical protein n=1 Tax=unclassified Sphingomonas TaxID=196159 RepID=UPI0020169C28|nr:hypothetical protein [Sphingomonas sp. 3P27F8]